MATTRDVKPAGNRRPFASAAPDGLDRVAEDHGFAGEGRLHAVQQDAPIAGYAFPGIGDEELAKGVAGFVGTLAAFGIGSGIAHALRRRTREARWQGSSTTPST